MNFANRYELSESITTGTVETFPARDASSDERVLIYVFENDAPQPPNVPTIEWVLQAFNKIAPPPKELVINAGRYAGTAFVYLVTKMPAPDVLSQWIESYQRYGTETQEFQAIPKPESATPAVAQPSLERATNAGIPEPSLSTPTEAFPVTAEDPSRHTQDKTGSFTSLFLAGINKSTEGSQPQEIGHPINPDFASSALDAFATAPHRLSSVPQDRGTGEFTKFFKGPFSGEASPDTPKNLSSTPVPAANTGEFTRVFGSVGGAPQEMPLAPATRIPTEKLSLTQILAESPTPRAELDMPAPPTMAFEPRSVAPVQAEEREPTVSGAPVPQTPTPAWQRDPAAVVPVPAATPLNPNTASLDKENATQLFSSSGRAVEHTLPAGPSEYTMIISRASIPLMEPPGEPAMQGAGAAKPRGTPMPPVAIPPVPAPPKMPAMPPFPPMPAVPAAPKRPQTPPEPKPVSYWPLILVMTVLFFLAALLVMYFVLKH